MGKPIVYIASPYSKGDAAINTHFQCQIFDQLLTDGRSIPVAPLWTHFQHTLFPRPYKDWIEYDKSLLHLYDCCIRLTAVHSVGYSQGESAGADGEVAYFLHNKKKVFYSLESFFSWLDEVGDVAA